ncbi:MAG: formate dehydrogenase accessory sulfurtransferase FdhD [Candidatus Helarchaeota archaeon]|nr:formate dehydrogenase accessory sulfurtransferase FdhD [Candidatus Helarchaeota archaeon]
MKESISKLITQFSKGEFHNIEDEIAVETIISILVNGKSISSILCSPVLEKELAIGYLFTTGILESFEEIQSIDVENYNIDFRFKAQVNIEARLTNSLFVNRIISSGCGAPEYWLQVKKGKGLSSIDSRLQVQVHNIFKMIADLNQNSKMFRQTGALHAAGLYDPEANQIIVAEDIGRHNAVDKVIGYSISHEIRLDDKILVSTGRLTADIIFKSAKGKIPIVASMAAATDSGISTANITNTTLIGFVRGKRLNIYTNPFRITNKSKDI